MFNDLLVNLLILTYTRLERRGGPLGAIVSNNSIKTNYAGENDIVTLSLVASENIIEPTVVFQSNGAGITNTVSYSVQELLGLHNIQ